LTDYPDESILNYLWGNVKKNIPKDNIFENEEPDGRWCTVQGYDWGTDTTKLKEYQRLFVLLIYRIVGKYDLLFLSDLLWYTSAHEGLIHSIVALLASNGKTWIGCGGYTTLEVCEAFMVRAKQRGLESKKVQLDDEWQGNQETSLTNLRERKKRVWLWEMGWEKNSGKT
jgi:hypothetical protein